MNLRSGFYNTAKKLSTGCPVTIGFLGGSITEARNGWRSRTMNWFRTHYPDVTFREVNASIGGTNSKYAAFRIKPHLLDSAQFDLIFVEFAVNDLTLTREDSVQCYRSMEGVIRKIRSTQAQSDICLIYTLSTPAFEALRQNTVTLPVAIHEKVASHYNTPSVFFGNEVANTIESGNAVFSDKIVDLINGKNHSGQFVFAEDGVHPDSYGHGLYENVLKRCLPVLINTTCTTDTILPHPLRSDNYENAGLYLPDISRNYGLQWISSGQMPDSLKFLEPVILRGTNYLYSSSPNAYYEFTFEGTEVGVSCIYGMYTGTLVIEVDDVPFEYRIFDKFCTFNRPNFVFHACSKGIHKVRIYKGNSLSIAEKKSIIGTGKFVFNELYNRNIVLISAILVDGIMKND